MDVWQWLSRQFPTNNNEANESKPPEKNLKPSLSHTLSEFDDCTDLIHRTFPSIEVEIVYFSNLVDKAELAQEVLKPLSNILAKEVDELLKQSHFVETKDAKSLIKGILEGQAALFHRDQAFLINIFGPKSRPIENSQTESVIIGPHDAFVESAITNISLIRRRLKSSHLKVIKLAVGEVTKTDVYIMYIQDLVNMKFVDELVRRTKLIEIDQVFEGSMFTQYIDDFPDSIFPQYLTSERPDAMVSRLTGGRVVCVVDGSPAVISAPISFFEFFSSPDDYYQRWLLGTATRLLRFGAFIITILFTAFYVSVTTFHYEMIPETLLLTITESRSRVPFPPVYEAIIMELSIEFLREAGARLPTKIGQTIGIVGGIVIGQAAVQAGLTSNILIIAVATSAIASFVMPSYVMSASIRLVRFGLIILAGIWGNLGLMIGIALLIIHLSKLTSLGASYLMPIAPFKFNDWLDIFVRGPFWALKKRPSQARSPNRVRNKIRK